MELFKCTAILGRLRRPRYPSPPRRTGLVAHRVSVRPVTNSARDLVVLLFPLRVRKALVPRAHRPMLRRDSAWTPTRIELPGDHFRLGDADHILDRRIRICLALWAPAFHRSLDTPDNFAALARRSGRFLRHARRPRNLLRRARAAAIVWQSAKPHLTGTAQRLLPMLVQRRNIGDHLPTEAVLNHATWEPASHGRPGRLKSRAGQRGRAVLALNAIEQNGNLADKPCDIVPLQRRVDSLQRLELTVL